MIGQAASRVVLMVEDNPIDVEITRSALFLDRPSVDFRVVEGGIEALEYLLKQNGFASVPTPHLVILDLNLPGMNGKDVLRRIKESPTLSTIPVLVFSSSLTAEDVRECYALRANCYVTKPEDLATYERVIRSFGDFWLRCARLPDAVGTN